MTSLYFPCVLEKELDSDYGVFFPDLPGLVAAGKDQQEAMRNAEEALQLHIDGLIEHRQLVPAPTNPDELKLAVRKSYLSVAMIRVTLQGRARRVHLTIDENLLGEIDQAASVAGYTRSGFVAEAARRMIRDD